MLEYLPFDERPGKRHLRSGKGVHVGAEVKKAVAALALLLPLALPAGAAETVAPMTAHYSQQDLLKNWALSACLAAVATDEVARADANATASAYMEFGRQDPAAYDALRQLAEQYARRNYGGSVPGQFNTMKCIDLYHSRELGRLVTKLSKPARPGATR